MEKLSGHIFCSNGNCFNKETLELFSLEPEYLEVLRKACNGLVISDAQKSILEEIESSGSLAEHGTLTENHFSPEFVAFRIVLGEVCNLRCANCFVLNREHLPVVMGDDTLERIINETFPYGADRPIKYHFFGGEPLLMFDQLTHAVRMIEDAVNRGMIRRPTLTITTNGTMIDHAIADYLHRHDIGVGISIDGPKPINDAIRGEGTYEKILAGYEILQEVGVRCWFLITPYAHLLDELPNFVDSLIERYQPSSITFNTPFDGLSIGWAVPGLRFADQLLEVYRRQRSSNVRIESAIGPVLYAMSTGIRRIYPCSIANRELMASISVDGRVSFCAQYWGSDLFTGSFVGHEPFRWQVDKPPSCHDCIAEYLCGGPCLVNYRKTGRLDAEKCSFYKRLVEKLITNPWEYLGNDQLVEESL